MVQRALIGFMVCCILCIIAHEVQTSPNHAVHRKNKKKHLDADHKSLTKKWDEDQTFVAEDDGQWLAETELQELKQEHSPSLPPTEDKIQTEETGTQERVSKNCSLCAMSEERKALRLAGIKNQILSQLGLSKPPNVTLKNLPRAPVIEDLLGNYNVQSDQPSHPSFQPGPEYGDEDEFHLTTEKVLSFAQPPPRLFPVDEREHILFFKISGNIIGDHIHTAELYVYLKPNRIIAERNISLFRISRHASHSHPELKQVGKQSFGNKSENGFWVKFDVKRSILHWFKHPKDNVLLLLRTSSPDPTELMIDSTENSSENSRPFIIVEVKKQLHRRTKRMIGLNCEENSNEVRCCRYPLTVDFEEFGWDWIIAPKRYEANYCSGECPYVFLQKYPHTHLVQQANPQGSAGPCCAPRKMSSISMLYFDEEYNIIYGMLPGMVVDRCGCS